MTTTVAPVRILIVDDEPNVVATMGPIFALEGYAVDVAGTDAEARLAIAAHSYDVVITDLRLTEGDGLSIVDDLGRDQPGTPAIILTGFGSLESAIEAMHRGAYDYLLKPCDVEELKATVQRAISHGRLSRELRGTFTALAQAATGGDPSGDVALRRALDEVNRLVAELDTAKRDLELSFARERANVARLRELDELKSQFISTVSHELRTPLTAIRGYGTLLLRRATGADQVVQQGLAAIDRAAEQLRVLIEDLLDMAAIEAGTLRVSPRRVELGDVVKSALLLSAPLAEEKKVKLVTAVPADIPAVRADAQRLGQVLGNLLSNAAKFTPEGGTISIEARRASGLVHVLVKDTGIGIPAEDQPKIFSRFFRSSASRPGGMGLGLSISRGIIEAHGGLIWVDSEPGRGTTVHFTLPLFDSSESA